MSTCGVYCLGAHHLDKAGQPPGRDGVSVMHESDGSVLSVFASAPLHTVSTAPVRRPILAKEHLIALQGNHTHTYTYLLDHLQGAEVGVARAVRLDVELGLGVEDEAAQVHRQVHTRVTVWHHLSSQRLRP
eukprot:1160914-Pelagomonas_calceolata.AAC.21